MVNSVGWNAAGKLDMVNVDFKRHKPTASILQSEECCGEMLVLTRGF